MNLDLPIPPPDFHHPTIPVEPNAVFRLCESYLPHVASRPGFWEERIIPADVPRFRLD